MILLQRKKLENNLPISQLWTSPKAYMKYAFLLHFFMVPIGCFATKPQGKYFQEDEYYDFYWAQSKKLTNIKKTPRKRVYAHKTCTLDDLKKHLGVLNSDYFAIFYSEEKEEESLNKLNKDGSSNEKNIGKLVVYSNLLEFFKGKGKEVITPDGIMKFDELPEKRSSVKTQESVNQTSIQNNNTNDGNDQSQEQQSDLKKNENNNKGNNTNNRIAIGIIIVAIVSTASYLLFSSKKIKKKVSNT